MLFLALISLLLYFIGGLPTGYWFTIHLFKLDITQHGSGNIGATNVARVLGKKRYFFLILFLDAIKAYMSLVCVAFLTLYFQQPLIYEHFLALSIALLVGNAYSPFLIMRGGKGVSTSIGILAYFAPFWLAIAVFFFIPFILLTSRIDISVLGSITCMTMLYLFFSEPTPLSYLFSFITLWSYARHRENIRRLIQT